MTIIQFMLAIFWLILLPLIIGHNGNFFFSYILGWIKMFALFQLIAIPCIFLYIKLNIVIIIWSILVFLWFSYYILVYRKNLYKKLLKNCKKWRPTCLGVVAFLLILTQLLATNALTHADDDDSFYVSTAVTADYTNTMYVYVGDTGNPYEKFPSRYVFSPFPIYTAMIARLIQVHPTILAHTIFPFFLISMSYMLYYLLALEIFRQDKRKAGLCIILLCILNSWGNISVYTAASFLLFRSWQGKAVLANIIIPFLIYLLTKEYKRSYLDLNKREIIFNQRNLFLSTTAASMVSSMGVFLAPILVGSYVLVFAFKSRKVLPLISFHNKINPTCFGSALETSSGI